MKKFFTFLSSTLTILSLVFSAGFSPQVANAQITPIETRPPRSGNIDLSDAEISGADLEDVNIGEALAEGGIQAIKSCLDQPLGEFGGILSSNLAAMSVEFLGGAGLVDKVGNIAATASNIIGAANSGVALVNNFIPFSPVGTKPVADVGVLATINATSRELTKLQGKVGSINARGLGSLNEVLREMQVSDNCIDRIAYIEGKQMLFDLQTDAVDWIKSGFENGQPGFVTNLLQRNRDLAAAEWLNFLDPDKAQFAEVCSVFREDVLFNVRQAYNRSFGGDPSRVVPETDLSVTEQRLMKEAVVGDVDQDCGLTNITGSNEGTEQFLAGNFIVGGWDGWLTMFNDPNSNPNTAARFNAAQLEQDIESRITADTAELDRSGGYLSDKQCKDKTPVGFSGICRDGSEPETITPGATVAVIMNELIASDIRRLELADEIGEVVENIGKTLIGGIIPRRSGSQSSGLTGITRTSFNEAYSEAVNRDLLGSNPDGFSIDQLNQQVAIEGNMYVVFEDIWKLRNSVGMEDAGQCTQTDRTTTLIDEFNAIVRSIIPGSEESIKAQDTYEAPGQYKIDWAGNDLEWDYERVYGETGCGLETYGDVRNDDERGLLFTKFTENPRFSFRVPQDEETWKIALCVPTDDGGPVVEVPITYSPPAYRQANNLVKVDWNNIPFEWDYYDPFAQKNAYGIGSCGTDTAGEFAYSVGNSLADENFIFDYRKGYNATDIHGGPIDGDLTESSIRSWCSFVRDLTGLGEADSGCRQATSGNRPESFEEIRIGINRALNYLLGISIEKIKDRYTAPSQNMVWHVNRCSIRPEGGTIEGDELYRSFQDYYTNAGTLGPAFSDQPMATELDVLLANLAINLDGLVDLDAPDSIRSQVTPDTAAQREAIAEGLLDLQANLTNGTPVQATAQRFYELAKNREFHKVPDVNIAKEGYARALDLFSEILTETSGCQTTPDGGVPEILTRGDLRIEGANSSFELPDDYDQPITVQWSSDYCEDTVRVYRDDEALYSGEFGEEEDDDLIGIETTAQYSLYCGAKNPVRPSENRLDVINVSANLSTTSEEPTADDVTRATGSITVNARNNNFAVLNDQANLEVAWRSDNCPVDLYVYRDDTELYQGSASLSQFDNQTGNDGVYTYSLYCGSRENFSTVGLASFAPTTTVDSVSKRLDVISVTVYAEDTTTTTPVPTPPTTPTPGGEGGGGGGGGGGTGTGGGGGGGGTTPGGDGGGSGGGSDGGGSGGGGEGGGGTNPGGDGQDNDGDGCIDDTTADPDGQCNDGGGYDNPEPTGDENGDGIPDDQDGQDNDNDGCADDTLEDPDGSCDDGGNYTLGEDEMFTNVGGSLENTFLTNGIDDDGDGMVDDGPFSAYGQPETGDQANDGIDNDGDGAIDDTLADPDGLLNDGGNYASDESMFGQNNLPYDNLDDLVGENQVMARFTDWRWLILIIVLIIISGGGFWLWRRSRKKRDIVAANTAASARKSSLQ